MYEVDFDHDVQLSLEFSKIKQLEIWLKARESVANNNKVELLFKYIHNMGYNIRVIEDTELPEMKDQSYKKKQQQEFEAMS